MQALFRTQTESNRTESSSVRLSWVQLSWIEPSCGKWRKMCLQMSFQLAIEGGARSIAVISFAGRVGVSWVSALMRSLSRRNPVKVLSLSTSPTHTHTHTHTSNVSKGPSPKSRFSDLHANFLPTPRFPALYFCDNSAWKFMFSYPFA